MVFRIYYLALSMGDVSSHAWYVYVIYTPWLGASIPPAVEDVYVDITRGLQGQWVYIST